MSNSYTKETVSPVSQKQEQGPSEQSLWNREPTNIRSQPIKKQMTL